MGRPSSCNADVAVTPDRGLKRTLRKLPFLVLQGQELFFLFDEFSLLDEIVLVGELDVHALELLLQQPDLLLG